MNTVRTESNTSAAPSALPVGSASGAASVAGPVTAPAAEEEREGEAAPLRYSDLANMAPPTDRHYRRMTRERMEEESQLNSSAGSLWKMDGQTSFLFAENKHRREGDPTSIKMEAQAVKLIESKVAVIQDLMRELEAQKIKAEEDAKKAEEERLRLAKIEEEKRIRAEQIAQGLIEEDPFEGQYPVLPTTAAAAGSTEAAPEANRQPASQQAAPPSTAKEEKVDLKDIEILPSKVVEKRSDGLYRVRGQQFLTIKKKPYKVIATGLVRPEDFSDSGINSSKLLDAQYDVVHVKKASE